MHETRLAVVAWGRLWHNLSYVVQDVQPVDSEGHSWGIYIYVYIYIDIHFTNQPRRMMLGAPKAIIMDAAFLERANGLLLHSATGIAKSRQGSQGKVNTH